MRQSRCERCGFKKWVNIITFRGAIVGEYCADCFDRVPNDAPVFRRIPAGWPGPYHNDPGFDNVVRAMEEDR